MLNSSLRTRVLTIRSSTSPIAADQDRAVVLIAEQVTAEALEADTEAVAVEHDTANTAAAAEVARIDIHHGLADRVDFHLQKQAFILLTIITSNASNSTTRTVRLKTS